MRFRGLIFFLKLFLCSMAWSEDQVIVYADQDFKSTERFIFTQKDIQKSQAVKLTTLLSSVANVNIASSNLLPDSIYIRGGNSSHVLVIVDGVPFYDVGSIQRTADLDLIQLRSIARIEILKGSQSVVYGGQAISAVIKIETFISDQTKKNQIYVQGGSFYKEAQGLFQKSFDHLYDAKKTTAGLNLRYQNQDQLSAVKDSIKRYPQKLQFFEFFLKQEFDSDWVSFYKYQNYLDQSQLAATDFNTGAAQDTEQFKGSSQIQNHILNLTKKNKFIFSLNQTYHDRDYFQEAQFDPNQFGLDEKYDGELIVARADYLDILNSAFLKINLGLSYKKETLFYTSTFLSTPTVATDAFLEFYSAYVKLEKNINDLWLIEAGFRQDQVGSKSFADSYQLGLTYNQNTKLEYSTGFNPGSLYQVYGQFGRADLKPEKVKNISLSWSSDYIDLNEFRSNFSFSIFKSDYLQLINFRAGRYENIDRAETTGAEFQAQISHDKLGSKLRLSLGYQEPKDLNQKNWLIRRSLRTATLIYEQNLMDQQLNTGLEIYHVGSRRDQFFDTTTQNITLKSYNLVNFYMNFNISKNIESFLRIENALEEKYQPIYGFFQKERTARAGLNFLL